MPKRPIQHELEAYSRSRFGTLIPSNWVFRGLDQDYGIDGEIEVFECNHESTGIKFLVQLKATSSSKENPSISLKSGTLAYYKSLTLPVLIVLYIKKSDSFYFRWAHSHDFHYTKNESKVVKFGFTSINKWDARTPEVLNKDVISYLELRSSRISMPVEFSALIFGKEIEEDFSKRIEYSIIKNSLKASRLIRIDSRNDLPNNISISSKEIKIELARTNGFTAHTANVGFFSLTTDEISSTVMTSIGMALFAHGHHIEAAEIIQKFLEHSIYVNDYSFCFMAARCLARANKYVQATELAERISNNEKQLLSFHALLLPLWTEKNMSESEVCLCVDAAKRIARILQSKGDSVQASTIYYNLGNMLRKSDLRNSFSNYKHAAKINSEYFERSYFWREIAGIAFLKKRYASAVFFYKRSIDLEDDKTTRFLYADALAFAGRYAESLEEITQSLPDEIDQDHVEWYLKSKSVSFLISFLSITRQTRVKSNFHDVPEPKKLNDKTIKTICMKSLELDAMCALSWFNLGGVFHREGKAELALNCFLTSALIEPCDIESWANAAAIAFMEQQIIDASMVLICAYLFNGGDFLEHMSGRLPSNGADFLLEFSKAMAFVKRTENSALLRIHGPNNTWDSYDIPSTHY